MNRRAWLVCGVFVGAFLCSTPRAGATSTDLRLMRGRSSAGDSVLVRGRSPRDAGAWRLYLRACGCSSDWAWSVFEVRARASGRLILFDKRGKKYEPDRPCARWGIPPSCFAFYGLSGGDVARGVWIVGDDTTNVEP